MATCKIDNSRSLEMGVENDQVIELVGEGSFGKVFKGRRKYNQFVAMKFILKHGKSETDIHNLRQEIEILSKLKHENIIQMLDSFESPQSCSASSVNMPKVNYLRFLKMINAFLWTRLRKSLNSWSEP